MTAIYAGIIGTVGGLVLIILAIHFLILRFRAQCTCCCCNYDDFCFPKLWCKKCKPLLTGQSPV